MPSLGGFGDDEPRYTEATHVVRLCVITAETNQEAVHSPTDATYLGHIDRS